MATQNELKTQIETITAQVIKIGAETGKSLTLIEELKAALANQPDVTPELQAAVDSLAEQVKRTDDMVPDPVEPPVEPPTEPTA